MRITRTSAHITTPTQMTKITDIAHATCAPGDDRPLLHQRQSTALWDQENRQHLHEVGQCGWVFNGCDELALKKPPPLVPSILILPEKLLAPLVTAVAILQWSSSLIRQKVLQRTLLNKKQCDHNATGANTHNVMRSRSTQALRACSCSGG